MLNAAEVPMLFVGVGIWNFPHEFFSFRRTRLALARDPRTTDPHRSSHLLRCRPAKTARPNRRARLPESPNNLSQLLPPQREESLAGCDHRLHRPCPRPPTMA